MTCTRLGGAKHRTAARPPYSAEGCAWQVRQGNDGRSYVSQPNDRGQFVWVLVRPGRTQRARSAVGRALVQHGPAAAQFAVDRAARMLHARVLPGINYFNHQAAWYGPSYVQR